MYVLVRKDLKPEYQAVQGGHALAEFGVNNPTAFKKWGNQTVVYLHVENEEHLMDWYTHFNERAGCRKRKAVFWEPDIDEHTAMAVFHDGGQSNLGDDTVERNLSKLPLMKFKKAI